MDDFVEGSVKNPAKSNLSGTEMREFERQAEVKLREKRLRQFLGPLEGFILTVQSLLVWEKPARSAVMLVCVHILFWFAVTTHYRAVFIGAASGMVLVSMETIRTKVWPEIRVPQPDDNDEGWTPVHAKLLSLPELCEHIARLWVTVERLYTSLWELRRDYPSKFCLYVCSVCLVLAATGHYFSGVVISYLIVTGLLLWPALEYHNVLGSVYQRLGPILQQLDHSIDSPHRDKKLRAQKRNRSNPAADTASSSDSDLDEFCPTPGPAVDAALAHAAGRSARGSSATLAGLFGGLSKGLSLECTDDEFTDTEPPSYMGGISQVPSFDNTAYDQSADELEIDLPYDDHPPVPGNPEHVKERGERKTRGTPEGMPFDPAHFRDSTDVDEALAEDLEFPDVETDGKLGRRNSRGHQAGRDEPLMPPGAAMLLSQTVTALMSDALTKLQDMGSQDNASHSEPSQVLRRHKMPASEPSVDRDPSPPKLLSMDSDSADFEVLDRAELEQEGGRGAGEKKDEDKPRRSGYGIGYLTSWLSGKK